MYLVVRDDQNNIDAVYGYIRVSDVVKYANNKYPDDHARWEISVPIEYIGDVIYLPEERDV